MLVRAARRRSYTLRSVALTEEDIAKFYSGFANEIIWPLFHDMPSRCNFDPEYWATYQNVNRKFAKVVAETAQADDFVWVHDYHLMLTAAALREMGTRARMGFFLHIPFPSPDVFEKLPWKKPILESLLEFDVIGFQGDRDRSNFVSCLERLLPEARSRAVIRICESVCTDDGRWSAHFRLASILKHLSATPSGPRSQPMRLKSENGFRMTYWFWV